MIEWLYLVLGFSSLFALQKGQTRTAKTGRLAKFYLRLFGAVVVLVVIQNICNIFAWSTSGYQELGTASIFLWAILLDWAVNGIKKKEKGRGEAALAISRFALALFAFSAWTLEDGAIPASTMRFFLGLSLPLVTGFLEWVLIGLWNRLRLSDVPERVQGNPALFWIAMILALGICKFG